MARCWPRVESLSPPGYCLVQEWSYACVNQRQLVSKFNFTFLSLAGLLLSLANVSGGQNPGSAATGLDVYDGFETARLSKVWDTDRFEPGAVTMQTNIVRAGHGAAEIVVRAKDKFEPGLNGDSNSERDELLEARKLTSKENVPYEFSFSMFFPTNFPIVPTRLVVAQWKQYCANGGKCDGGSPARPFVRSPVRLRIPRISTARTKHRYQERGGFAVRWLDFKFRVRFSPGEMGASRRGSATNNSWISKVSPPILKMKPPIIPARAFFISRWGCIGT